MESQGEQNNEHPEGAAPQENPKVMSLTDEYLQNMVKLTEGQLKRMKTIFKK